MKNKMCVSAAAAVFAVLAGSASANIVNITSFGYGQEGNGAFTGTIDYSGGVLIISLTNDATTLAGGKITGFAFNINGNASASLTNQTHPFADLGSPVSASPFPDFDHGAAMGGSWLGGGSPNAGITIGNTGTFTWSVTGPDAGTLTAEDFIGSFPDVEFAVRFRGFDNDGSDKTPGYLVPAPGAASLLGLAGLAAARRRR